MKNNSDNDILYKINDRSEAYNDPSEGGGGGGGGTGTTSTTTSPKSITTKKAILTTTPSLTETTTRTSTNDEYYFKHIPEGGGTVNLLFYAKKGSTYLYGKGIPTITKTNGDLPTLKYLNEEDYKKGSNVDLDFGRVSMITNASNDGATFTIKYKHPDSNSPEKTLKIKLDGNSSSSTTRTTTKPSSLIEDLEFLMSYIMDDVWYNALRPRINVYLTPTTNYKNINDLGGNQYWETYDPQIINIQLKPNNWPENGADESVFRLKIKFNLSNNKRVNISLISPTSQWYLKYESNAVVRISPSLKLGKLEINMFTIYTGNTENINMTHCPTSDTPILIKCSLDYPDGIDFPMVVPESATIILNFID